MSNAKKASAGEEMVTAQPRSIHLSWRIAQASGVVQGNWPKHRMSVRVHTDCDRLGGKARRPYFSSSSHILWANAAIPDKLRLNIAQYNTT